MLNLDIRLWDWSSHLTAVHDRPCLRWNVGYCYLLGGVNGGLESFSCDDVGFWPRLSSLFSKITGYRHESTVGRGDSNYIIKYLPLEYILSGGRRKPREPRR